MSKSLFVKAVALGAIAVFQMHASSFGSVIISEFMYNAAGSDGNREWVEIYNAGNTSVNLEGWMLHDEDAGSQPGSPIPSGTTLNAGQALVLVEDQATFEQDWGTGINLLVYPGMGTDLNMANAGTDVGDEVLQLRDADGNLVDAVDYMSSAPFPSIESGTETSIYVLPEFLDPVSNDLGTSWARSTAGVHGAYMAFDRSEAGSPGAVVPEPASVVLAGLFAAGAFVIRRR